MSPKDSFQALEAQFAEEKAHALGRIAKRMERALAELRAFDLAAAEGVPPPGPVRADLVAAAAEAVWFYVVQRDVLGWHRHDEALRAYAVPAEVMVRLGPRIRKT